MPESIEDVSLIFLNISREKLAEIQKRPPLVCALQNFETALLLLAHGRHPQALSTLASAIESAGKAHLHLQPKDSFDLAQANAKLNAELPKEKAFKLSALQKLRETRNRITHYGFSRRDDEESVRLIFSTALPFLDAWMEHSVGVSIVDSLVLDLGPKVQLAIDLIRSEPKAQISAVDAIRGVVHWILHHTRLSYLTWWEQEVLNSDASTIGTGIVSGFDLKNDLLEKLLRGDPAVVIDCPICGTSESLVVKIDDAELENKRLIPSAARCVECSLSLQKTASDLLIKLCADQLTEEFCAKTLNDYGIK